MFMRCFLRRSGIDAVLVIGVWSTLLFAASGCYDKHPEYERLFECNGYSDCLSGYDCVEAGQKTVCSDMDGCGWDGCPSGQACLKDECYTCTSLSCRVVEPSGDVIFDDVISEDLTSYDVRDDDGQCTLNACGYCGETPEESCNNIDDDCDGQTDEDLGSETCGVGVCALSPQPVCVDGEPAFCDPRLFASEEVCNLVDDDCDGSTDETMGTYYCGVGQCRHEVLNCVSGVKGYCDPMEGSSSEVCNGRDDDCDGSTDESLGTYYCGTGACRHEVYNCEDGEEGYCDPTYGASSETCNNRDDDCDGSTDESLGTFSCGTGRCRHDVLNCVNGSRGTCNTQLNARTETCDDTDDDCDGSTDEGTACNVVGHTSWSAWFSEESGGRYCNAGTVIVGWRCSGDFCDNVSYLYGSAPFQSGSPRKLTAQYSEEQGAFYAGSGEVIVGAYCYGEYCDALSYYVATTNMSMRTSCRWTSSISDENGDGGIVFPSGYYLVGVSCSGRFCDNMAFYICKP